MVRVFIGMMAIFCFCSCVPSVGLTEIPDPFDQPTPTIIPIQTNTHLPKPSATPKDNRNRSAIENEPITPPTRTPGPTKTPSPTPPGLARLDEVDWVEISPDGKWLWGIHYFQKENRQIGRFEIASLDGAVLWTVEPQALDFGDWSTIAYSPFSWSPDGSNLYLAGEVCCWTGPGSFYSKANLVRLDLLTGISTVLVPYQTGFHAFSFSPSGKYLARTSYNEHQIQLIRMSDGSQTRIPVPEDFNDIGGAQWSPDEKYVVMLVYLEDDNPEDEIPALSLYILIEPGSSEYWIMFSNVRAQLQLSENDVFDSGWVDASHFQISGNHLNYFYDTETQEISN